MTFNRRTFLSLGATGLALAAVSAPTLALAVQSAISVVNAAKDAGIIGEVADGYVGARLDGQVTPQIRAAMAEINAGRAELYRQAAAAAGTQAAAAGASSFQQRFNDIPSGHWYKDVSGTWRQK